METPLSQEYEQMLERLRHHFTTYGDVDLGTQLVKIQEELGEAAGAYIGWTGSNPRKGTTHHSSDVAMELADVVITALLGIIYAGYDPNAILVKQADKTIARLDEFDRGR